MPSLELVMCAKGFVKIGDTVGIKEPNLYSGVGTVKEEDRGIVEAFALGKKAVIVRFPQYSGTTMLFCHDVVVYSKPCVRGKCRNYCKPICNATEHSK
jgi:hypothetical protein